MRHRQSLRLLLVGATGLLTAAGAYAERISLSEATAVAREFFTSSPQVMKSQSKAHGAPTAQPEVLAAGEAYYVFAQRKAEGSGFVIVAADDALTPIVGYAADARFSPDNIPAGLKAYLSDYERVARAIADGRVKYAATRGGDAVAPLMTVKWNQSEPYNLLTPVEGGPTGCVATAVAQVMKHHQFPPAGRGIAGDQNLSYPDQKITLGHRYDWSSMLDEYDYDGYTDAQAQAVATLMRDVGYALNMEYGQNSSMAYDCRIPSVMCRHFNYATDIKFAYRSAYSTDAWTAEIRSSLKAGRPVIYSGSDGREGHSFVCDGIDANDMLHINWGWGGYGDGYFDMNILSPDYLGIGAGSGAYYKDQSIIANIHPGDPAKDQTAWHAPMTLMDNRVSSTAQADGLMGDWLTLNANVFNTSGFATTYDDFATAMLIEDAAGKPVGLYGAWSVHELPVAYYRGAVADCEPAWLIASGVLKEGKYTARMVLVPGAKRDNATAADILPVYDGDLNRVCFTVKDGKAYFDDITQTSGHADKSLRLRGVKAGSDNKIYCNSEFECVLTLGNGASIPYADRTCFIMLVPEAADAPDIDLTQFTTAGAENVFIYGNAQAEVTIKCYGAPSAPGRYRLYVLDDYNSKIESDEPVWVDVVNLPSDEIVMTSALTLDRPAYPRNIQVRFAITFSCNNPFDKSVSGIELRARKAGAADDAEFLLAGFDDITLTPGLNHVESRAWSERDALWYEDMGEYEVRITYTDAEGCPQPVAGVGNRATFTLTEDEMTYQAEMTAPAVINGGKAVPAVSWTYFDIEMEIMSPTGVSIDPSTACTEVYKSPRGNDWTYSFAPVSFTFEKTELAPGESTKVKITYLYRANENEADLIGKTLYFRMDKFGTTDGNECRPRSGKFEQSLAFRLVDPNDASISEIEADTDTVPAERFSLDGRPSPANSRPGIYIERRANGSARKVFLK